MDPIADLKRRATMADTISDQIHVQDRDNDRQVKTLPDPRCDNPNASPEPSELETRVRNRTQLAYYSNKAHLSNWLRNFVAATPIASVVSDPRLPDNPIIAVNQAFIDLTGYLSGDVLDRNCRFLSGTGTEPWLTEKISEGVLAYRPVLVEILNYKKCGTPFRNAVLVAPIYDDEDELVYFLGSQIEIGGSGQSISENRQERAVACLKQLTPRQLEVTKLVAKGLLNKQVAQVLGLSIKTIKMHRGLVMQKLELRTQADLIRLAVEAGI
jgi:DNA-binding CsgD family transcriptional regulator